MLAVLFVVEDPSKGYRLAYRYPPEVSSVSSDKVHESMATLNELCRDSGGKTVARLLRPKEHSMCNNSFRLSVNNLLFVGHPTTIQAPVILNNADEDSTVEKKITFFNVVFAMEWLRSDMNDSESNSSGKAPSLEVVSEVAERLSYALLCEEKRCSFLSQVCSKHTPYDNSTHKQASGGIDSYDSDDGDDEDGEALVYGGGEVAALLKDVYSSLLLKQSLGLTVNGWLDLSVRLRPSMSDVDHSSNETLFFNGSYHASLDGNFNQMFAKRDAKDSLSDVEVISTFRPYQTMLLLQDEQTVVNALPPDSSHQLLALVRAANPLLSFRELSVTTGVPLKQVHKLSAHLSYWGQAAVIDTIVMDNQYCLHPGCMKDDSGDLTVSFHAHFRGVQSLHRVLSFFKPNLSLSDIMRLNVPPRSHLVFLHMMIWLLQHGLLQQLHPHVYLFRPLSTEYDECRGNNFNSGETDEETRKDRDEGEVDRECLEIADEDVASLFRGIVFHLLSAAELNSRTGDGNEANGVRLLELLWREHVTKQQFEAVMNKYSDHLYICWHP